MIAHHQNPGNTLVITNDNDIKRFVKKKGGKLLDCESFYNEIVKTLGWAKKRLPKEYKSKYEGVSNNSDKEYWLDAFKDECGATKLKPDAPSKELMQDELLSKYFGPSKMKLITGYSSSMKTRKIMKRLKMK